MRFRPAPERFWEKVNKTETCWLWTGFINRGGYGRFNLTSAVAVLAHRFAYQDQVGSVPPGSYVCHRCDVPACVRPDHLFIGTPKDNFLDMARKGRRFIQDPAKTCREGHSKADAIHRPLRGWVCRECRNEKRRNQYAAAKGAQLSNGENHA